MPRSAIGRCALSFTRLPGVLRTAKYGWFDKSDSELLDELLSGTREEVLGRIADGERMYDLAAELLEL